MCSERIQLPLHRESTYGKNRRTTVKNLFKLATGNKNCEWIYRFWANPGRPWGGIVPPSPVLAPESALGSRPRVALSSAQVFSVYLAGLWLGNFPLLGLGSPPGVGRRQLLSPRGPDGLRATGQLLRWRDVGDRAMQPHRVVVGHELGDQPPSVLQAQRGCDPKMGLRCISLRLLTCGYVRHLLVVRIAQNAVDFSVFKGVGSQILGDRRLA